MFHVRKGDKEIFSDKSLSFCWSYVRSKLLHPNKEIREEAAQFTVTKNGKPYRPPHYVRIFYGL